MKSNFDFLKEDFPVLANFGELAEQYCYHDSNSCLDIFLAMRPVELIRAMSVQNL